MREGMAVGVGESVSVGECVHVFTDLFSARSP